MTDLSRRTVLGASATGAAVAMVGVSVPDLAVAAPTAPTAAPRRARGVTRDAKLYRRQRFLKQRKARFTVSGGGMRLKMKLVAIEDIPSVAPGSKRSFSLTFRAQRRGPEQGTYQVKRSRFDRTSLFLVPTDDTHRTYRAVINNR